MSVSTDPSACVIRHSTGLPGRQTGQTDQANPIIFPDPLVIGGILECQSQQPLLLEIRFMNASETAGNHRNPAKQPRR